MQKCIFVCTLQDLSVLDIGDVISTSIQIRSNMGGKQDGSLSVFYDAGEDMKDLIP